MVKDIKLEEDAKKIAELEGKVVSYENSRIVGTAIRFSLFLKSFKPHVSQVIANVLFKMKMIIPSRVRRIISYFLRLKWLMRPVQVINKKYPDPLVTVVTPYYNHGKTIKETADSVLGQTFQNFEYIIVNDGSTNEQSKILHSLKTEKITIVEHSSNLGKGSPAAARNTGIKQARGKYIICLDADDIMDPTYIEKLVISIETDPGVSLVTTNLKLFGTNIGTYDFGSYKAKKLIKRNLVSTASIFIKTGWEAVGGYTEGIGYEDWEFWIKLAENGYWGKNIHESLLNYRTALSSRFIEDQKKHRGNIEKIRKLHPFYRGRIRKIFLKNYFKPKVIDLGSAFNNLNHENLYRSTGNKNKGILVAIPWMTFGGAETLICNFTKEIKNEFNISFVTGLSCDHAWEYKFKGISKNIYHLPNLFGRNKNLYLEFISNYIKTRDIKIFHVIHTNFVFDFLPELKKRHPQLRIVITMFNDFVNYFNESIAYDDYVSYFSTDNNKVANSYANKIRDKGKIKVIPNGIDGYNIFNPDIYNKKVERKMLELTEKDLAVFFIGRLSKEKNPDVFTKVAKKLSGNGNMKFFIVGDGPMKKEIEEVIKGYENIKYLGYQKDIAKYLSASDVFVLPSAVEGFPLSILEAMAMKLIVVASRVGAIPDIIKEGKNGFIVTPGSAEEIAKILIKLENNRPLLKKVSEESRKSYEQNYSNKILKENYTNFYREVLK